MSETRPKILFMDDEPTSDIVTHAMERLRTAGFAVDFVETMSEAIEAYYQKYYDGFILDIDMSHQAADQEGDGVKVLKRFISLHNQTRVILFSGAGTVQHWFQAANAHCYAYVHKLDHDQTTGDDSIEILIRQARAAVGNRRAYGSVRGYTASESPADQRRSRIRYASPYRYSRGAWGGLGD